MAKRRGRVYPVSAIDPKYMPHWYENERIEIDFAIRIKTTDNQFIAGVSEEPVAKVFCRAALVEHRAREALETWRNRKNLRLADFQAALDSLEAALAYDPPAGEYPKPEDHVDTETEE